MAVSGNALQQAQRCAMIEGQLRRRGIHDERVLEAMYAVPRHEFVRPADAARAYEDRPLPIGEAGTISQPYMVASMTQAARVQPGDRVLEVGTGTGYQAAVLARLGAKVVTIERNVRLVEEARLRLARLAYDSIEVIWGDGSAGHPEAAPYQAIIVTAGAPGAPDALVEQLAEGGRLVIPIGTLERQDLHLIVKYNGQTVTRILEACQFVPLLGRYAWPEAPERIN